MICVAVPSHRKGSAMSLIDILQQYASRPTSTETDFDEVAPQLPPDVLGDGIAQAFRSDQTPAFGNMVEQLFGGSNPSQRAGLLNQLIAALGPAVLGKLGGMLTGGGAGGGGGGLLGGLFGGAGTGNNNGGAASGSPPAITPELAEQVTPSQVREMAEQAKQADPGVMDRIGGFYAQHPELVKMLGGAALAIALGRIANRTPR